MNSSDSKHSSDLRVEDIEKTSSSQQPAIDAHYDPKYVQRTLLKIDLRMLPLLGLLYAVALVDRTNLGIARIAGMNSDLKLNVNERYSIASMIYFIPYILLQLPGNIILRWLGARTWLTICVVGWGTAQLGMGFVPTWGYLSLCRALLGVFEAGFFPALVFIITTWYKRHEVQKRQVFNFWYALLINIFFQRLRRILAYALTGLKGKGGINGWAWIFIIEGIITITLGVLTWLFVPDFPDKNRFLTEEQTKMILDRVEADRGDAIPDKITGTKIIKHLSDWTLWAFGILAFKIILASSTSLIFVSFSSDVLIIYDACLRYGFFITIILGTMGYNTKMALLLTAPPTFLLYAVYSVSAAVSCYFFAWLSDKTRQRALWLAVQNIITMAGLLITAYAKVNGVRYFGLFLVNAGASGCVPGVLAYSANNITSHSKRAVSTATIIAAGGVGGIFATTVYRQQDFPRYLNGIWATMGCQLLMVALLTATSFTFKRRNQLARQGKIASLEDTPGFYYTI
ncbi:major facilitator superfamily domain-containing protein [Cyathus striatus]|nr:major facilitator superfamily domain-containing protein [Cyathus striatus]